MVSYDLPSGFKEWLYRNYRPKTAESIYIYCKKFGYMLTDNKLTELHSLTTNIQRHTMSALAALSKYEGIYKQYHSALEELGIKRSNGASVDIFKRIYDNGNNDNGNNLLDWLLTAKRLIKPEYSFAISYMALTGLRTMESVESLNIIAKDGLADYYNQEMRTLEHFKYPHIFLRNTKNAYISIVPPMLLHRCQDWQYRTLTYQKVKTAIKRKGLPVRLYDLRSWYATYLRQHGIESEFIDLLQGRIPASIFTRHYYRPNIQALAAKVISILEPISHKLLETT
jgi:intergrase/recombinase